MLTMLASWIPNMHGVRKVGHPGAHSTHQRVITSAIFKRNRRVYSNLILHMES